MDLEKTVELVPLFQVATSDLESEVAGRDLGSPEQTSVQKWCIRPVEAGLGHDKRETAFGEPMAVFFSFWCPFEPTLKWVTHTTKTCGQKQLTASACLLGTWQARDWASYRLFSRCYFALPMEPNLVVGSGG